jgi:transcriptional regulator with XRE-family HTH domain
MPTKPKLNDEIAKRIREARKQAGLTQQELASHLRRTSAAISDLERGKVQVTAVDLHSLADLLHQPIEYFYGEEFGGNEMRDLIYVLRKSPAEIRKQAVPGIKYSLRIIEIAQVISNVSDGEQLRALIAEYMGIMQAASDQSKALSATLAEKNDEIQARLAGILNSARLHSPQLEIDHLQANEPKRKRRSS